MDTKDILLMQLKDKIPNDSMLFLKESLDKVDKKNLELISFLNLKSPILGLALGVLFGIFGVDRFYKGDIFLGIAKITLFWASCFTIGFLRVIGAYNFIVIIAFSGFIIAYIWTLADLFFVYFGIKKDNLAKIFQVLNSDNL